MHTPVLPSLMYCCTDVPLHTWCQVVDALCVMACEEAEGGEAAENDAATLTPRSMASQV